MMLKTNFSKPLKQSLILFLLGTVSSLGFSPNVSAETLKDALASAYQTNPSLAAAQAEMRATGEDVAAAQAGWLPQASFIGAVSQNVASQTSPLVGEQSHVDNTQKNMKLNISQNIYKGGATEAESQKADLNVLVQSAALRKTEQDLLMATIKAYLAVLLNQSKLDLSITNEALLQKQLAQGKARFELGDLTLTDVSQIEARLAEATSERIEAESALESARAQYVSLIGQMPEKLVFPEAPTFLPEDKSTALNIALQHNPELIKAQFSEKVAKTDIEKTLAGLCPSFDFDVDLSRSERQFQKDRVYDGTATLKLTVPLNISGGQQSQVRKARQIANQKRLEAFAVRSNLEATVSANFDAIKSNDAQISKFIEQVKASEIALKGMRLEEELGSRTMTDLLNAEKEHFKAQVGLVEARVKALQARYQILADMGELTLARLDLGIAPYNPEPELNQISKAPYTTAITSEPPQIAEEEANQKTEELEETA